MLDVLQLKNYRVSANGINGLAEMLNGGPVVPRGVDVIKASGLNEFYPESVSSNLTTGQMQSHFFALNGKMESNTGMYGDHWSQSFIDGVSKTAQIRAALDGVSLNEEYSGSTGKRLKMVSQLIKARVVRGVNRDAFHVFLGGFDTHSDLKGTLNTLFLDMNGGFTSFFNEMDAENITESVTMVVGSEFGRVSNSGVCQYV